jgi:L-seryl-tRNA(Ser) seleniumtransferase
VAGARAGGTPRGPGADRPVPALRRLPAMHAVLAQEVLGPWIAELGRQRVRAAAAEVLGEVRAILRSGAPPAAVPTAGEVAARTAARLAGQARPRLRRVINATGIVLHTGLGRAPLAPEAIRAVAEVAAGYCNLEMDLDSGERGDRGAPVAEALQALTGAEAALVVNNNAAAVLLVLAALASGREVVVSRGELVEIGGSFRVPDVMAQSGARLREVGTTNRTYARDYAAAVGPETALLLKVHRSNFRLVGFVASPTVAELAAVARQEGVPLVYDMGSGALLPGLAGADGDPGTADVGAALRAGADLVTFSGDKLLGGPQAGVICGRADLVRRCARHPLMRALRVDKLTLAALGATLELYRAGRAAEAVPTLRMLRRGPEELRRIARLLRRGLEARLGGSCAVEVEAAESLAGGGALPEVGLPTWVVALRPGTCSAQALAQALRHGEPPVVARLREDAVLLDPRTLQPEDLRDLPALVAGALARAASGG